MNPEEIKAAAERYCRDLYNGELYYYHTEDFEAGANWAIEEYKESILNEFCNWLLMKQAISDVKLMHSNQISMFVTEYLNHKT